MKATSFILAFFFIANNSIYSQAGFSFSSDLDIQRSFKKDQKFWTIGPTVQVIFHTTHKDGIYAWFGYYSNGKFSNRLIATAKNPATTPSQVVFTNHAGMKLKQFSIGWKKYIKGALNAEKGWNLFSNAGFGLLFGRITNTFRVSPDTSLYEVPVYSGEAFFKRLTLDLGLGIEFPLKGDLYFYSEGRVWIPTTDYPSRHLFVNDNAPFVGMLCLGFRVLF